MAKYGFYFNQTECVGCRTCQVACKDKNNLDKVSFRRVQTFETGVFPNARIYHQSVTCNHCENPACVAGCPTGAMHIAEDGTVQHNDADCIGCRYCVWNCPYGIPQVMPSGITGKCDSCKDLREKGENPACVDACMMRCLEWGELSELEAKYGAESVRSLPILPDENITNPSTLIKPRAAAFDKAFVEKEV